MPYTPGSKLAVPGLEATIEPGYVVESFGGDSWTNVLYAGDYRLLLDDGSPFLINDRSGLEVVRLSDIQGIQSDPEVRDLRQPNPAEHGERAGTLRYGGRTIGLTGTIEAGDIPAMRDLYERFKDVFNEREIDLLLHTPGEVDALINYVKNPVAGVDLTGWNENASAGGTAFTRLASPNTPATSTAIRSQGTSPLSGGPWSPGISMGPGTANYIPVTPGEIVSARAIFYMATKPASVTTLDFRIRFYTAAGATVSGGDVISSTAVSSGVTYEVAVNGAAVPPTAAYANIMATTTLTGFSETWDYRASAFTFTKSATAPKVFDGGMPGYVFTGKAHASTSYGPIDQSNMVIDHTTIDSTYWESSITAGATINTAPTASRAWSPITGGSSIYFKYTNPDATTRAFGTRTKATNVPDRFQVRPGRTYRGTVDVNLLQKPASGAVLQIVWLDSGGSSTGVTAQTTIANLGVTLGVTVSGVAPVGATAAYLRVHINNTAVSGAVYEGYLARPFFADVTEFDGGRFTILQRRTAVDENGMVTRHVPKATLIRRVRKASSIEAPEKQNGYRYQRDFTAALRAADPRLYSPDERRANLTLVGSPNYVSNTPRLNPTYYAQSPNTRPPTGYTQDEYTQVGSTAPQWTAAYLNGPVIAQEGVQLINYNFSTPFGITRYRVYRSAEGYTYTRPSAVLKAQPNGPWGVPIRYFNAPGSESAWNYIGLVLKRTATASIECRFNGDGHNQPWYAGPDPAKDMEIWIDLAAGGLTKVAEFDLPYAIGDATMVSGVGLYSTMVGADPHLTAKIDASNRIIFQLWNTYPGPGAVMLGEVIHQMTAGQITELGGAVAGSVGMVWGVSNNMYAGTLGGGPTIYYMEARADNVAAVNQNVLVMGNIEVPYVMDLRGDVVNPVVTITNPDGEQHFARLLDTIAEANPVTINSRDGTIMDTNGLSRFTGFQPGSAMGYLKPGLNNVQIDALTWGTGPHAYMRWRDARR